MGRLHDASVLTGPLSPLPTLIVPQGGEGGSHSVAKSLPAIEVRQADPGYLSRGDILEIGGIDYLLSHIEWINGYAEFTGNGANQVESLYLTITSVTDSSQIIRLWLPLDGQVRTYTGEVGQTITSYTPHFSYAEPRWTWSGISADDDFKINVTCFVAGTLIETETGPRRVETLRVGDMVRTRDHGMQPLRWLGGRRLSAADLAANPKLNPIRIEPGALGAGMPARALSVSPQHRMLVRSPIAERMTGSAEVLIAAVHLTGHPGIGRVGAEDGIGYWHLMFDRHEIVFAEGAEAESLYLGPMAMAAMSDEAVDELRALFPDLVGSDRADPPPTARPVMRGKPVATLIERQVRNFKPLVAALD